MTHPAPTTETPLGLLLVDDHPVVREGLAALIGRQRDMAVVGEARDGREAVALYAAHRPDVLLLDLPPGTGDIAISVAQLLPSSELIVVTTPQLAAAEVAERCERIASLALLAPVGRGGGHVVGDGHLAHRYAGGLEFLGRHGEVQDVARVVAVEKHDAGSAVGGPGGVRQLLQRRAHGLVVAVGPQLLEPLDLLAQHVLVNIVCRAHVEVLPDRRALELRL